MILPKRVEPCPIVDSVVELRFQSATFPNAVFGIIYTALKDQYSEVEKLPILQLPEQLRDSDPNFKFKAHYRVVSADKYSVQIGPDVIVIGAPDPYPGWYDFSQRIYDVVEQVLKSGIISSVTRLGIRFINFFEEDIFDKVALHIIANDKKLSSRNTLLRTEVEKDSFLNTLQIANSVTRTINNKMSVGSIIDIDTFKDYTDTEFNAIYREEIELGHNTEKRIFFELLKAEFLETLNPKY